MRWNIWRQRQWREADLQEEIDFDLAMESEEGMQSGMAPEEARRASRRGFGNVASVKESVREIWSWNSLERLAQDLRYGWRTLRKSPRFTATATMLLAFGLGANTAIFSFMDAILLRRLAVPHPEELVILNWHAKAFPAVAHHFSGNWFSDPHTGSTGNSFPYAALEVVRADRDVLTGAFAFTNANLNVIVHGEAEQKSVQFVSGDFFRVLDLAPTTGRWIAPEDDRFGAAPVAVISYRYWESGFGRSANAVGEGMAINGTLFTIVGVCGRDFRGMSPASGPDVYIPLSASTAFSAQAADRNRFADPNRYWLQMAGRLRSGVGFAAARAQLVARFHQFVDGTAASAEEKVTLPELVIEEGAGGLDTLRREYRKPLYVLITLVGLIVAIACANIASLLLARAAARRREIAIRLSVGAARARVVRQLFTESLLVAFVGGSLAVPVGLAGIRFITWLLANGRANFTLDAKLNWRVLGFTFGLTLLTGCLFGLAPAVRATRVDVTPALKESRNASGAGFVRRGGMRASAGQLLLVVQVAVTLVLVIGAGLFVRTLTNLNAVELGFNRENVLLFRLNAQQAGYKDAALARFYTDLWKRFGAMAGVRAASVSDYPLVSNSGSNYGVMVPGVPRAQGREGREAGTSLLHVGPGFFSTMQIPILLGREVDERDLAGSRKVAVVNEVFARKYFDGANPVGRRFGLEDAKTADIEIVGVARPARYSSLKQEVPPVVYIPYSQELRMLGQAVFELRTAGDPLALAKTVRETIHAVEPRLPVTNVTTQSRQIDETINQERTFASLCTCFAVLALGIACAGLYGTMAYAVARRTGEIGIRMALGATRGQMMRMVLGESCATAGAGVAIGLAVALATSRYVESFLFGIRPNDPVAMGLAVAVLAAATVSAGYGPAWRACTIDPVVALREE
jgi:predicted permease